MYWPTESRPVPLEELGWVKTTYLATASSRCDPTIIWGTTVETESLVQFVTEQRRLTGAMISTAHVLIRAVVAALYQHPELNRRVIGRRIYPYDGIHITMPFMETRAGNVNVIYLRHAEQMSLAEISRAIWENARDAAVRSSSEARDQSQRSRLHNWLQGMKKKIRLHWTHRMANFGFFVTNRWRLPTTILAEINGTSAFVNYLGFADSPPMIAYKPSSLPSNSFGVSVTMGASEPRAIVEDGVIVVRNVAPLFVRVDHRLVNGYQMAEFIKTLRASLKNPTTLAASSPES